MRTLSSSGSVPCCPERDRVIFAVSDRDEGVSIGTRRGGAISDITANRTSAPGVPAITATSPSEHAGRHGRGDRKLPELPAIWSLPSAADPGPETKEAVSDLVQEALVDAPAPRTQAAGRAGRKRQTSCARGSASSSCTRSSTQYARVSLDWQASDRARSLPRDGRGRPGPG